MSDVQPSLFDTVDPKTLVRRHDPETSRAAARSLGGKAGSMRRTLLLAFSHEPLTSEEAAERSDLDPWQASKRTSDLLNLKLIEPTGKTRMGSSGRQQRVLRMTLLGREALKGGPDGQEKRYQ